MQNPVLSTPVYRYTADVYGCGSYGSGTYDKSQQCMTAPNTGYAPQETSAQQTVSMGYLVLGFVLLLVALGSFVALTRSRRNKKR